MRAGDVRWMALRTSFLAALLVARGRRNDPPAADLLRAGDDRAAAHLVCRRSAGPAHRQRAFERGDLPHRAPCARLDPALVSRAAEISTAIRSSRAATRPTRSTSSASKSCVSHDDDIDDQVAEDDNFGVMMANYTAVYAPDETIDGRRVHVVLLNNRYTGQTTMRVHDRQCDTTWCSSVSSTQATDPSSRRHVWTKSVIPDRFPPASSRFPQDCDAVNGTTRSTPSDNVTRVVADAPASRRPAPNICPKASHPTAADVISVNGVPTLHLLLLRRYSHRLAVSKRQRHGRRSFAIPRQRRRPSAKSPRGTSKRVRQRCLPGRTAVAIMRSSAISR